MEEEAKKQRGTAKFSPSRLAVSGGSKGGVVRGGVNSLLTEELGMEIHSGEGVVKTEKFPHNRK